MGRYNAFFLGMMSVFSFHFGMISPNDLPDDLPDDLPEILPKRKLPPARSDAEAIAQDWRNVGKDLRSAMAGYDEIGEKS
jgi:hypothetical protein